MVELTQTEQDKLTELFPGWTPVVNEEKSLTDFDKPVKGKYNARIVELKRLDGISKTGNEYDFLSLKMQVTGTHSGDNASNRYMDKTYSMMDSEWSTAEEDQRKLLNDLFTAGIFNSFVPEKPGIDGLLEESGALMDKSLTISAYGTKKGKQAVKIIPFVELPQGEEGSDGWDN